MYQEMLSEGAYNNYSEYCTLNELARQEYEDEQVKEEQLREMQLEEMQLEEKTAYESHSSHTPCDDPGTDGHYHCPYAQDGEYVSCRDMCGLGVDD